MSDIKKSKKSRSSKKSASEMYKKMSQHEHILKLPDSYIGSVEPDTVSIWILGESSSGEAQIVKKEITYVPGLYKIYDEIIVNARDHSVRDKKCLEIRVNIDQEKNQITIRNSGQGIPIEIHEKEKIHIPEMIFGNLLTSSNYDQKGKTVGGKNGYGAKLANIYSTHFRITTVNSHNKKKYTQDFFDNMYTIKKPEIVSFKGSPYTEVMFSPDLARFGLTELSDDLVALFKKRVYDVAASTSNRVKVYLNDQLIEVKSYTDYINLYYDMNDLENLPNVIYEEVNDRWKVGVIYDPERGYTHISSVNGICTYLGGTHVMHVMDQILGGITKHIKKSHKDISVKPSYIKDNITVFIDCVIEDPSFTSQTKEFMTSKLSTFGSRCDLSEGFIKKVIKSGIVDEAVKFAMLKMDAQMSKGEKGKVGSVRGIPKLEDAQWAGKKKAKYTRLILTEGDSAKTFAVHGLSVVGREKYGVFPLRGKLLNVRDASIKQLLNNAEIQNLKKILGLRQGVKYDDVSKLRYGGIIILTDQDVDGSHIKGLIINLFHYYWPSLLKIDGFIQSMATPIIKVFKTSDRDMEKPLEVFYNLTQAQKWKTARGNLSGLKFKYYKGLGTSKPVEAKQCFTELDKNIITYCWNSSDENSSPQAVNNNLDVENDPELQTIPEEERDQDQDQDDSPDEKDRDMSATKAIVKAFDKRHVKDRKKWLAAYNPNHIVENTEREVSFADFVDKDLIHFSNYDNIRSIPSICDGFKPSQRKVLYGSFLRKLEKGEVKVAQLAGFVSDKAQYHHGEASLQGTIVGMAQNFVGENNIYLMKPNGDFGSRLMGGKDAASARYIFTRLNDITSKIFRKEDEPILDHVEEDGEVAEPIAYAPIIPMALVNGAEGIGTGYSTFIPKFNPLDLVTAIKRLLKKKKLKNDLYPWYYGHKGPMTRLNNTTYQSSGLVESIDQQTIRITELPVGTWTQNYLDKLNAMVPDDKHKTSEKKFIREVINNSGSDSVDITVRTRDNYLQNMIKNNTLKKTFKLEGNVNTSNMVMFSTEGTIKKYNDVKEILHEFFGYRLKMYDARKKYYVEYLRNLMLILKYKVKFLELKFDGRIVLENRKSKDVEKQMEKNGIPRMSSDFRAPEEKKTYQYITGMNLFSLTKEKADDLKAEYKKTKRELKEYEETPIEDIWDRELDEFLDHYSKFLEARKDDFGVKYDKFKEKSKKRRSRKKN